MEPYPPLPPARNKQACILENKINTSKKKKSIFVQTKTCTKKFIAALFTISERWKPPKYPSTDEHTDKQNMYIHRVKYYPAIKKK